MTGNPAGRSVGRSAYSGGEWRAGHRNVPEEVPVAFSLRGSTHAVMMASPSDLTDFAYGFCFSEGLIEVPADIVQLEEVPVEGGIDLQIGLREELQSAYSARRRQMAGPVGCGLCGVESIEEATRAVPPVKSDFFATPAGIARAVAALERGQDLNRLTRATHAAAFFQPSAGMLALREDVGRHNALDKLAGAMLRQGVPAANGLVVISSRVSVEMVQKTARMGAPILVAVSAPTALAIEVADAAGITLVAVARGEDFEIFTHANRIEHSRTSHVG